MDIWGKAGIKPGGDWYIVTKDFMMATLKRADAEKGYFMTDSSTWVSASKEIKTLKVLFKAMMPVELDGSGSTLFQHLPFKENVRFR
jgi:tungstate transport system substrate-binding protein